MIDNKLWTRIAGNWSLEDDGIDIPGDRAREAAKARGIRDDDLTLYNSVSNDEIDDILSDLGLG